MPTKIHILSDIPFDTFLGLYTFSTKNAQWIKFIGKNINQTGLFKYILQNIYQKWVLSNQKFTSS